MKNKTVQPIFVVNVSVNHVVFTLTVASLQYYYSVKDISVGGMCICYGHARSCPWDEVTQVS